MTGRRLRLPLCAMLSGSLPLIASQSLPAQRPALSPAVRAYLSVDSPVVALTHARIIEGTGAPARDDQTLVIRDGRISALGPSSSLAIPAGALVIYLSGKSVLPGLVMVHEHLFYPTGPGVYGNVAESFTRLYLAGGVTSMRTGGNMTGFGDFGIKPPIDSGKKTGPWIDATAPYLEGPGLGLDQVHELTGPDDARRMVGFWADAGATSFKAYTHITRAELGAAIREAHKRGMKVTGHLCSVTYREAASLGIDDLEHGFFVSTDFVANKKPDECPGQSVGQAAVNAVDANGEAVRSLIADLVSRGSHFFLCNNAFSGSVSGAASVLKRSPAETYRYMSGHFISNAMLVPAGVMALNATQEAHFTYVAS